MDTPTKEELQLLHTNICRAVGDPTRILLMYAMHDAPQNVTSLARALDLPQSTVSRHIAVLRNAGVVQAKRDGQSTIYQLTTPHIIGVLDQMRRILRDILDNQAQIVVGTST